MELFIEIEFKVSEFDKIDKVLYHLSNEGWDMYNTQEFWIENQGEPKQIISRKYKFRRII